MKDKGKEMALQFGGVVAGILVDKAIENVPGIIEINTNAIQ